MSSSGSRGPPPNRYNDRRKSSYNARRSLGSSGSGYSSQTPSYSGTSNTGASSQPLPSSTGGSAGSSSADYSTVPSGRRYNNSSGFGYSSSSYGSKYNSSGYYSGYGSYNGNSSSSGFKERDGGDGASAAVSNSSESPSFYSRPAGSNRGSLSNSIPKRDRPPRNNSLSSTKRSDTYYPSKSYFTKSQVDHYSTKKKYSYSSGYNSGYYDQGNGNSQYYSYKKGHPSSSGSYSSYNSSYSGPSYDDESFKGRDRTSSSAIKQTEDESYDPAGVSYDDSTADITNGTHDDAGDAKNTSRKTPEPEVKQEQREDHEREKEKEEIENKEENSNKEEGDDEDQQEEHDPEVSMEVDSPLPEKDLEPGKDLDEVEQEVASVSAQQTANEEPEYKFPLQRLEAEFEDLKKEYEAKDPPKYAKVTDNIKEYPFYQRNIVFYQQKKKVLSKILAEEYSSVKAYKIKLWKEYKSWTAKATAERKNMDEQLKYLHPPNDEMKKDLRSADISVKTDAGTPMPSTPTGKQPEGFENTSVTGGFGSRRSSRRHGDLVTTEAEFEEVLKNLSKQDDEDPYLKALRVSAPVPELILSDNEKLLLNYMDSNNIVTDKEQWAGRVRTHFFDNFSPEEHQLFCDGFVKYPKKFGYISKYMGGLRTMGECVIHYYLTKKAVNYKNLIAQHKKKNTKKVNKKKSKSRNVSVGEDGDKRPADDEAPDQAASEREEESKPVSPVMSPVLEAKPAVSHVEDKADKKKRPANVEEPPAKRVHVEDPGSPVQQQTIDVKKKQRKKKEEEPEPQPSQMEVKELPNENGIEGTGTDDKSKKFITSYWSITEASAFPVLLQEHGTKWTTIADKLSTKTATMVRNYFQRNAEKYNWTNVAQDADKRLEEKFAAVVGKPEDEREDHSLPSQAPPQAQPLQQPPPSFPPLAPNQLPFQQMPQHPMPQLHHFTPPVSTMPPYQPNPVSFKPNIGALLTATTPAYPQPTKTAGESHKPSIMSLLNNDSPSRSPAPTEVPPSAPLEPRRNNISALLNSPSNPEGHDKPQY